MAGTTLSTLSQILRDVYMGPARIEAVPVKVWTCSKHRHPVNDRYEEVCLAAEALGIECDDPYECPHVVSRKVSDGCSECKTSEYATVLDAMTGEEVWEAKLFSTMQWELERNSILLSELTQACKQGKPIKIVVEKGTPIDRRFRDS